MDPRNPPVTPPPQSWLHRHQSTSSFPFNNSPFSDYQTDSAYSCPSYRTSPSHHKYGRSHTLPTLSTTHLEASPSQERLLRRVEDIRTHILRSEPSERSASELDERLDRIETVLNQPEVMSKEMADVADSGLFMDDDESVQDEHDDAVKEVDVEGQDQSAGVDAALQEMLVNLTDVVAELGKRYEECKHINDLHVEKLEKSAQAIVQLQSENEVLRSDLSFDHSELLFLKLQLKALEVQALPYLDQESGRDQALVEGIERWKLDWKDVDERLKARRVKYASSRGRKLQEHMRKDSAFSHVEKHDPSPAKEEEHPESFVEPERVEEDEAQVQDGIAVGLQPLYQESPAPEEVEETIIEKVAPVIVYADQGIQVGEPEEKKKAATAVYADANTQTDHASVAEAAAQTSQGDEKATKIETIDVGFQTTEDPNDAADESKDERVPITYLSMATQTDLETASDNALPLDETSAHPSSTSTISMHIEASAAVRKSPITVNKTKRVIIRRQPSPWTRLWNELADLAGIYDYDE